MRYYLDTQTLAQVIFSPDEIDPSLRETLIDYSNLLRTSAVCIKELVHLIQTGRIKPRRKGKPYNAREALSAIQRTGIEIIPPDLRHLEALADLPLFPDHNDPNDRLIVAQAVADRIPLISSDRKLILYADCGLELVENR